MITALDLVVDYAGHRWTVEIVIPEGVPLNVPGWLTRSSVVSCVDNEGAGLPRSAWMKLVESNAGGLTFRLAVERAAFSDIQKIAEGSSLALERIRAGHLRNLRDPSKDGEAKALEEGRQAKALPEPPA